MAHKIEINNMTVDELMAYVEKTKQQNRDRVKKHYYNTIKTNPEKYEHFKKKCLESTNKKNAKVSE